MHSAARDLRICESSESSYLSYFRQGARVLALSLPHDYRKIVQAWGELRSQMARCKHAAFSRSEWAYLMTFLEPCRLRQIFEHNFGQGCDAAVPEQLWVPRGPTAVWLPNNVSLLGPLTLILLSLVGAPVGLKAGSRSDDLSSALLDYCREHLGDGPLRSFLEGQVQRYRFARDSQQAHELAQWSQTRIVFGSNAAAQAVDALTHQVASQTLAFVDRQSEIWLDSAELDDKTLRELIAVFSVYGRLGCTSPRRVILLRGTLEDAGVLAGRLAKLWGQVVKTKAEPHVASATLLSSQWARALGHQTLRVPGANAVLTWSDDPSQEPGGNEVLSIYARGVEQRLTELPENTQTIGHAFCTAQLLELLPKIASCSAVRMVPIARMHHFSSLWDGEEFWRRLFLVKEIGQ